MTQYQHSVPPLIAKILSYRKVQNGAPSERKSLLAFPATREDVAAVIRGLPARKAAGPDSLRETQGVHVAQWAKRPPLKLEVPG